jgi:Cys-tRNA(Pro)/Cys-tRNA(Cys) deacylase
MPPKMAGATPATDALRRASIVHRVHQYAAGTPRAAGGRDEGTSYGLAAAASLGVEPARVLKTLVASVDGQLVAAVVPVSTVLDLKRLADAAGGRRAVMADIATAERVSGSVIGGISPLGMRRRLRTFVDATVATHATVFISAGRRGLQVELAPEALVELAGATLASLGRD